MSEGFACARSSYPRPSRSQRPRAKVLDPHVGPRGEPAKGRRALGLSHVDGDGALVAVVHELSFVSVADVEFGKFWRGAAQLEFGSSEFEEVDLLTPRTVGPGWVYPMAFSVVGGKTLPLEGRQ